MLGAPLMKNDRNWSGSFCVTLLTDGQTDATMANECCVPYLTKDTHNLFLWGIIWCESIHNFIEQMLQPLCVDIYIIFP